MNTLKALNTFKQLLGCFTIGDLVNDHFLVDDAICDWAQALNDEFLRSIGLPDNSDFELMRECASIARKTQDVPMCSNVADAVVSLWLYRPDPKFNPEKLEGGDTARCHLEVVFCENRIITGLESEVFIIQQTITREEAVRLIVFHFAEQMLRMIKALSWDKAQGALAIYDRVERIIFPSD